MRLNLKSSDVFYSSEVLYPFDMDSFCCAKRVWRRNFCIQTCECRHYCEEITESGGIPRASNPVQRLQPQYLDQMAVT